ncbi:hypothetical protein F5890DRAFT_1382107, partial [Lentinula detonsa]
KTYPIDVIDATAENKDGLAQCQNFEDTIDHIQKEYHCTVIYFLTDADGGSKKGRILLVKKRPYLLAPSCWSHQARSTLGDYFKVYTFGAQIAEEATFLIGWLNNHGKVRKIFDKAQANISKDRTGKAVILSYLVANITRWTTHCVAFMRLLDVREALQLAVMQSRGTIIAAQVGAAKYSEKDRLEPEAIRACDLIADGRERRFSFWSGLETVVGDIEPICFGTNISQKDSARADQVLLTIAGIFLHFVGHPEFQLSGEMVQRIEKRWKDCDQPLFITALILNNFEGLSAFGPRANLTHFKINNIIVAMYRRIKSRPDNTDTQDERREKERQLSAALLQYLASTGPFKDCDEEGNHAFEEVMGRDPITWWKTWKGSGNLKELAEFAILILEIVVNQAG